MITASIIGILAMIAIPKFAGLILKSKEASAKGNLGAVNGAINIFYADTEGTMPPMAPDGDEYTFRDTLVPRYIDALPIIQIPQHPGGVRDTASNSACGDFHYNIGWTYCYQMGGGTDVGRARISCTHTTSTGESWTTF
jgi:type II secretory pathway pseudopilin PulG